MDNFKSIECINKPINQVSKGEFHPQTSHKTVRVTKKQQYSKIRLESEYKNV